MADLGTKNKNVLDESRILLLGMQVLLGFELGAFLLPGFDRLPTEARAAKLVSLALMLIAFAIVLAPVPFHRIACEQKHRRTLHRFASTALAAGLLPFAVVLGIDIAVATLRTVGTAAGVAIGIALALGAAIAWYAPALVGARKEVVVDTERDAHDDLGHRIQRALTEVRVVLPGVQALLGFQLAGTLMDAFERLPWLSRAAHVAGLLLVALSAIVLMFPAAWHRLAERGEDSERLLRLASLALLVALVPLALGIACEVFVVVGALLRDDRAGAIAAALTALVFAIAWLVIPMFGRARLDRRGVSGSGAAAAARGSA